MNKSVILATAISAALAAPMANAEATFYGKVRLFVELATEDGAPGPKDEKTIGNLTSRVGYVGSEDLGNGLSAEYRWEASISDEQGSGLGLRRLYGGLKGDFGGVYIGSNWTPSYLVVRGAHDPFNTTMGFNVGGGNFPKTGRTDNAIWYSGKIGPATVAAATIAEDGTENINDAIDLGISVPVGPVTIGVAFGSLDEARLDGSETMSAVDIGWTGGGLSVNLGLFQTDLDGDASDQLSLTGSYATGTGKFVLQLEDDGTDNQTSVAYWHDLSKTKQLTVEMTSGDLGTDQTNVGINFNF